MAGLAPTGIAGHANLVTMMQIQAHLDTDNVRTSIDLMSDLYEAENG